MYIIQINATSVETVIWSVKCSGKSINSVSWGSEARWHNNISGDLELVVGASEFSYKLNSEAPSHGLASLLFTGKQGSSGAVLQVITCRRPYFLNFHPSCTPLPSSPPGLVYLTPPPPNNPNVPPYLRLNRIPPFGRHNGRTVWWRLCSGSGIPPLIRNLSFTDHRTSLWALY